MLEEGEVAWNVGIGTVYSAGQPQNKIICVWGEVSALLDIDKTRLHNGRI